VIVAAGSGAIHATMAAVAAQSNALSASTDMSCVQAGHCVLGVRAAPKVEIYVSGSAATKAELVFEQAFRLMVKEL
jgi:hypothetical protein